MYILHKLTRKRNATHIFPQHFVSRANINATFIYIHMLVRDGAIHVTVINRLRERVIHLCQSARCQALTRHQYLLCFFFISVFIK